jgi:hypothetical protein
MWAPLYAVLNYIMTMAAKSKTLAALAVSNEAGITIASSAISIRSTLAAAIKPLEYLKNNKKIAFR